MITIGILADTHISSCTEAFKAQTKRAFSSCDVIIHAGDLTDQSILSAFEGKEIHAVHGNMCNLTTKQSLPYEKLLEISGYSIGICHGAGLTATIEERMWNLFPDADCIIFGHTHTPLCERQGSTLFINPGSFRSTGSYGASATYAILTVDNQGMHAKIYTLPNL
jgi:uncharacterized protein